MGPPVESPFATDTQPKSPFSPGAPSTSGQSPFASKSSEKSPFSTEANILYGIAQGNSTAINNLLKQGKYLEAINLSRTERQDVIKNVLAYIYETNVLDELEGAQKVLAFIDEHQDVIGAHFAKKHRAIYLLKLALATCNCSPKENLHKIRLVLGKESDTQISSRYDETLAQIIGESLPQTGRTRFFRQKLGPKIWGEYEKAGLKDEVAVEKAKLELEEKYYSFKVEKKEPKEIRKFLKKQIEKYSKEKNQKIKIALLQKAIELLHNEYLNDEKADIAEAKNYFTDLKKKGFLALIGFDANKVLETFDPVVNLGDAIQKLIKGIKRKDFPAEGIVLTPQDNGTPVKNFQRVKVYIDVVPGMAKLGTRTLLELLEKTANKYSSLGITVDKVNQKVTLKVGEKTYDVVFEQREIPDGSGWATDRSYRKLNDDEQEAQEMLIDLGYLQPDKAHDNNTFRAINYEGVRFYFSAVTKYSPGFYDPATRDAMGQFNASAFNKGDDQKVDARFTEENLTKLEEKHKELMSSRAVVAVRLKPWKYAKITKTKDVEAYVASNKRFDYDDSSGCIILKNGKMTAAERDSLKNIASSEEEKIEIDLLYIESQKPKLRGETAPDTLAVGFYGVDGEKLLKGYNKEELLILARKLHAAKKDSTQSYLMLDPKEIFTENGQKQLALAILMFYMDNNDAINDRTPNPGALLKQHKNNAEHRDLSLKDLQEMSGKGRNLYAKQAAQLIGEKAGHEEQYQFICITERFIKVLDEKVGSSPKATEEYLHAEPGPSVKSRTYKPQEAVQFAAQHPYGALIVRVLQGLNIPVEDQTIYDAIYIEDLEKIVKYLNPFDNEKLVLPYIHVVLSDFAINGLPSEKGLLRDLLKNETDQGIKDVLELLIEQKPLDPTNPLHHEYRIDIKKAGKDALDRLYIKMQTEPDKYNAHAIKLIYWIRSSYYSDAPGMNEDVEALKDLLAFMKEEKEKGGKVTVLKPDLDYHSTRSVSDKRYKKGVEVLRRLAKGSKIGAALGSGVRSVGPDKHWTGEILDGAKDIAAKPFKIAIKILSGEFDPTSDSLGVAGVEQWRIMSLMKEYYQSKGIKVEWEKLYEQYQKVRKDIEAMGDKSGEYASMPREERIEKLQKLYEEQEYLEARLNFFFVSLTRITKDFYDWFCKEKLSGNAVLDALGDYVFDPVNRRLMEQHAFKRAHGYGKVSYNELKEKVLGAADDEELKQYGWSSLSPMAEGEKASEAKQALAKLISILPANDSWFMPWTNPDIEIFAVMQKAMVLGSAPAYHIGADIQTMALFYADPAERTELALHTFNMDPDQVDAKVMGVFIKAYRQLLTRAGVFEKYRKNYDALNALHRELISSGKTITINTNKLGDEIKDEAARPGEILMSATFILNMVMGKTHPNSKGINVLTGLADEARTEIQRKSLPAEIARKIGLPIFDPDWWNEVDSDQKFEAPNLFSGAGVDHYLGTPLKELGWTLITFGPWMGYQFGFVLPANLITTIGKAVAGEKVLDMDDDGFPLVKDDGTLQFRSVGAKDVADSALTLGVTIALFRNWAPMFYEMIGVFDDVRDGNYWQAYWKFAIANFFMLASNKGFFESVMGRTLTVDRWAAKSLLKILDFAKACAARTRWNDVLLDDASRFFKSRAGKAFIASLEKMRRALEIGAEKGGIGFIADKIQGTEFFQKLIKDHARLKMRGDSWVGKAASRALYHAPGAVRFAIDPLGTSMIAAGKAAQAEGWKGKIAGGYSAALNTTFKFFFETSRLPYYQWKLFTKVAKRLRERAARKGQTADLKDQFNRLLPWELYAYSLAVTEGRIDPKTTPIEQQAAIVEQRLRHEFTSGDLLGNLNPGEVIIELKPDGTYKVVSGDIRDTKVAIDEVIRSLRKPTPTGQFKWTVAIKGVNGELPITRIRIGSYGSMVSPHAVDLAVVKPSRSSPATPEYSSAEIHIKPELLDIPARIGKHSRDMLSRMKLKGIQHPDLAGKEEILSFEALAERMKKAGLTVEELSAENKAALDGVLKESTAAKLIEYLKSEDITVSNENFEKIETYLIRNLVQEPRLRNPEDVKRMIWDAAEAAKNLGQGTGYKVKTIGDRETIELTNRGKEAVMRLVEKLYGTRDFVECQIAIERVQTYLEADHFATEVEKDKAEIERLEKLSDKAFEAEVKALYAEPREFGKLDFNSRIRAARLFMAAVKRTPGLGFYINHQQLMAGYLGTVSLGANQRISIDYATGEGKTITIALPQFIGFLKGKRLILSTSTTDTYSYKDFQANEAVLKMLGIDAYFLGEGEVESLSAKAKLAVKEGSRVVIYSNQDTPLFRKLFDGLSEVPGRIVLPLEIEKILNIVDEGDYKDPKSSARVSGGTGDRAKDYKQVELADWLIRNSGWINEKGEIIGEGNKYIIDPKSQSEISISKEGYEKLSELYEAKYGRPLPKLMHRFIEAALTVHCFYLEGRDYVLDGVLRGKVRRLIVRKILRREKGQAKGYIFRDRGSGTEQRGVQFDQLIHKALLAKIGATVKDPGMSTVEVKPYDFLKGVDTVLLSGSLFPLAEDLAMLGYTSIPIKEYFPRTRVDLTGIMVRDISTQKGMVVEWAVSQFLQGRPVMVHCGVDKENGKILSNEEVIKAIEAEIELIRKGDSATLTKYQKYLAEGETAQSRLDVIETEIARRNSADAKRSDLWTFDKAKADRVLVQKLSSESDVTRAQKLAERVGFYGVITVSDTANRAMDPGKEKVALAVKDSARVEAGLELVSIVTEWKESVRHFVQEINRICRPNKNTGLRDKGYVMFIYQANDPNIQGQEVGEFLRKTLLKGDTKGILVLPTDAPKTTDPADLKQMREMEARFLLDQGIISEGEAAKYIEDGTYSAERKSVMDMIQNYRMLMEEKGNASLFEGSEGNGAEKFIREMTDRVHDIFMNDSKTYSELVKEGRVKAIEWALEKFGISDGVPAEKWPLRNLLTYIRKRYGLKITLKGEFTNAFELKDGILKALEASYARRPSHQPLPDKRVTGEILLSMIAEERLLLTAILQDLNYPKEYIIAEYGTSRDVILRNLDQIIERRVWERIAAGPEGLKPRLKNVMGASGSMEETVRFGQSRGINADKYYSYVREIRVVASLAVEPGSPDYLSHIEKLIASKLEAIKAGAYIEESMLIEVEGTKYDLLSLEANPETGAKGIRELNEHLKNMGSKKQVYISLNSNGFPEYIIYGNVESVVDKGSFRVIRFATEDVVTGEKEYGFTPSEGSKLLGPDAKREVIIRREMVNKAAKDLIEEAFGDKQVSKERTVFAKLFLRALGISSHVEALSREAEIAKTIELGIDRHERGHAWSMEENIPEINKQLTHRGHSSIYDTYEAIADFHSKGGLAFIIEKSRTNPKKAEALLFAHLFMKVEKQGRISSLAYELVYRSALKADGSIDFNKLERARQAAFTLLKDTYLKTNSRLDAVAPGATDPETELAEDKIVQEEYAKLEASLKKLLELKPEASVTIGPDGQPFKANEKPNSPVSIEANQTRPETPPIRVDDTNGSLAKASAADKKKLSEALEAKKGLIKGLYIDPAVEMTPRRIADLANRINNVSRSGYIFVLSSPEGPKPMLIDPSALGLEYIKPVEGGKMHFRRIADGQLLTFDSKGLTDYAETHGKQTGPAAEATSTYPRVSLNPTIKGFTILGRGPLRTEVGPAKPAATTERPGVTLKPESRPSETQARQHPREGVRGQVVRKVDANGYVTWEFVPETPQSTQPTAEASRPRPKLAEIAELAQTFKGKTALENPQVDSKVRETLKKHGYTGAELEKAMGELRLKRIAGKYFTSFSTANGFESRVAEILSSKAEAIGKMTAAEFAKLITSIELSANVNFRNKIDQLMDRFFDPLKRLGFTKAHILEIGEAAQKVHEKYVERQAGVAKEAQEVLDGKFVTDAKLGELIFALEGLANPEKTSAENLKKMGITREEAKAKAEELKQKRATPVEDRPATAEEADLIEKINKLAKRAGLSTVINKKSLAKLLEVLEDATQMEKLAKKLQEKLNPQELAKLLRKLIREGKISALQAAEILEIATKIQEDYQNKKINKELRKQIFKQQAAGLLVGLVTLIGAEAVAKYIGIENPNLHFAFVLGLAHVGNTASVSLFKGDLLKNCKDLLTSFKDVTKAFGTIATRTKLPRLKRARTILTIFNNKVTIPAMKFSVGLVSSLAMFSVVGRGYDQVLAALGVKADSALRSELGNMVASFAIPAGVGGVFQYIEGLLGQKVQGIAAAQGAQAAAKSAAARLLGGLRFAGTALNYVFVTTAAGDLLHSAFVSDYEADVQRRVIEILKEQGVYESGADSFIASIFMSSTHDSSVVNGGSHLKCYRLVHPAINKVLREDLESSYYIQQDIAFLAASLLMQDVQNGTKEAEQKLREYFTLVQWEDVTVKQPVNESPSRLIGQGGAPVAPQPGQMGMDSTYKDVSISEETIFDWVMDYCKNNKCGMTDQQVATAAISHFHLKDSNQYYGFMDKFQKAAFQSQVAYIHSLDPDSYYRPKKSNRKNDDIREMFTNKGALKPGKVATLMAWALRKHAYRGMIDQIETSSKELIAKGTEEKKLQHKMQIAQLRYAYLNEISSVKKQVLQDMLVAMGDNLDWANNQQKVAETKNLMADFDSLAHNTSLPDEKKAMLLLLLTAQLDELVKLA